MSLTVLHLNTFAQPADIKFVNYENIPGLENRSCIVRDSSGFIWLSGNGLARFDGIELKPYQKNDNLQNSLRSDNTNNLIVDRNGTLWITSGGLCYYTRALDGFTYIDKNTPHKITFAEAVVYDGKETIWFCSEKGLSSININSKKITETSLHDISYSSHAIIDKGGRVWVCTFTGNLYIYNPGNNSFSTFLIHDHSKNAILSYIFLDKFNNVWIAKNAEIINVDPENLKDKYGNLNYKAIPSLKNILLTGAPGCIQYLPAYTGDSILWMATYSHGLLAYNITSKIISATFLPDKSNPHSIAANTLSGLYVDKDNHLWISHINGISLLNIYNQNFRSRILELNNEPHAHIVSMEQDNEDPHIIWMGTYNGIIKYNWAQKKTVQWTKYFDSSGANNANTICDDAHGSLWIGSENSLFRYSKKINAFTKYPPLPTQNKFNFQTTIFKILSFHDTILIASNTGLLEYLPAIKQYKIIYSGKDSGMDVNSFYIFAMKKDSNGIVWCAGAKGLIRVTISNSTYTVYLFRDKINYAGFNRFTGIDFDGNNIVLAASAGIVLFNKSTKLFSKLSPAEDVVLNNSWDVKVDTSHNFWITTYYGLVFYNQKRNSHRTFTSGDGLPRTFSAVPMDMLNNTLIFKSRGRFAYINPYSVENNTSIPQPVITVFKIFEKPVLFDPGMVETESLPLTNKENFISFDFNAFEFNYPDKIQFAYRLTGLDKDWIYCGNKKNATYTNLSPGNYIFEMKASNSEGLWSRNAGFKIYIKPAFWQTTWFILLIAILLGFIIYGLVKRRIIKIRREADKKNETNKLIAEAEMKALRSQMNPHFIFNSLNSIQKYIWENKQDDASEYLTKFAKLIRLILENSGSKMVSLQNELTAIRIYVELEHRRSNHKFDYRITVDETLLPEHILVPPLLLQPYIENAIWHGLSSKKAHGTLSITIHNQNEFLVYTIDDDGIGREASLSISGSSHKSMGLNISSQRIQLLEKETNIKTELQIIDKKDENNMPAGTTVIVTLPLILSYA